MDVFVIRFSSLGDCVLLCPLLERLKQACGGEVVVLTKRAYADLFGAARGVDRVVAIDEGSTLRDLVRIADAWRSRDAVVIDAHASWRSRAVAARMGGSAARIEKHTGARLKLIVFKRRVTLPTMLERYAKLGAAAGAATAPLSPGGLRVDPDLEQRAEQAMRGETPFLAVAPGSRWPSKRWPGYAAVCATLSESTGVRILLVGDDRDRAAAAPIAAALKDRCVDLTGRARLMETAAHIARCRAFLGNDSGLMHLAEAMGVPVVGLFGPTVSEFGYSPSLPQSRTIERRLACRPCSRNGAAPCPKGTVECLQRIPPHAVVDALASLFDESAPRRVVLD
jgi:lipopolysaccharide heptosyltransferase II